MSDNQPTDSNSDGKKRSMNPLNKIPKPGGSKFNFNFTWIYGILFILIFGVQFMDFANKPKEVTWVAFEMEMLKNHDVAKLEVINKEYVNVFIKKDKLSQEKYKAVATKAFSNSANPGPHYFFTIGDVGSFEKKMEEAQKDFTDNDTVSISYGKEGSYLDILYWLLPVLLIILFWVFMMRRMGGGAGGSQGDPRTSGSQYDRSSC